MLRVNSFWKHPLKWPRTHKEKPSAISSQHENPRVRKKNEEEKNEHQHLEITWNWDHDVQVPSIHFSMSGSIWKCCFLYAKRSLTNQHHGVELSFRKGASGTNLGRQAIGTKNGKKSLAADGFQCWDSRSSLSIQSESLEDFCFIMFLTWCLDSKISVTLLASLWRSCGITGLPTGRLGYSNAFCCYYSGTPQFFWIWIEDLCILYLVPVLFASFV